MLYRHAEILSLEKYDETIQQPLNRVTNILEEQGIEPKKHDQTIEDMALIHDPTPARINNLVTDKLGQ